MKWKVDFNHQFPHQGSCSSTQKAKKPPRILPHLTRVAHEGEALIHPGESWKLRGRVEKANDARSMIGGSHLHLHLDEAVHAELISACGLSRGFEMDAPFGEVIFCY